MAVAMVKVGIVRMRVYDGFVHVFVGVRLRTVP